MALPRELLLDPQDYEAEKELERRVYHAIDTLSPFFRFQRNGHPLPEAEVTRKLIHPSYDLELNRVRACFYHCPLQSFIVGEEAGHYLHPKVNPEVGESSDDEDLVLRQMEEMVGRYSGIVYADLIGDEFKRIGHSENLSLVHKVPYLLAEEFYSNYGNDFLFQLSRMQYSEFEKLLKHIMEGQDEISLN